MSSPSYLDLAFKNWCMNIALLSGSGSGSDTWVKNKI